jgi:hypothetical protein
MKLWPQFGWWRSWISIALSHLAEWADERKNSVCNPSWKKPYALIREGADLLLRRRAMSAVPPEADDTPKIAFDSKGMNFTVTIPNLTISITQVP